MLFWAIVVLKWNREPVKVTMRQCQFSTKDPERQWSEVKKAKAQAEGGRKGSKTINIYTHVYIESVLSTLY